MRFARLPLALLILAAALPPVALGTGCEVGGYRLSDGRYVDIAPADGADLRWRMLDGTTGALVEGPEGRWASTLGWTGRADGIQVSFDCTHDSIDFAGASGARLEFAVVPTRFEVQGADLAGRLVMPPGGARVPVVVLVHGAERTSARDSYALQRMFPASGIGAFVYDKRGTGGSDGDYTHDYLTLAVDAIAAMREARRLAGDRLSRIGYQAGSQGGWVAPLAATIEPVDFLIVGFGLAVSPLRAERELITLDVVRRGYGPDVVEKAMEVADAVDAIAESNFQQGYERLAAVRRRYRDEPWLEHVRGSITAVLLETAPETLRTEGPKLVPGIPFHYDPMPVLRNLDAPQLWILGGSDLVAPAPETSRRLAALAESGRPITTAMFPQTDHGIYEFETRADGVRVSTRAPAGYFRMMRDFVVEGHIGKGYGAEVVSRGGSGDQPVQPR